MGALSLLAVGVLFVGFVLTVGRHVDEAGDLSPVLSWIVNRLKGVKFWHILALLGVLAVAATWPSPGFVLLGLGVFLAGLYARAWLIEFFFLMALTDDAFPGRFDKLIWALVLILFGPLGLWAFRRYHASQWPESIGERLSAKPAMPRDWA